MAVEDRFAVNRQLINAFPLETPVFHRSAKNLKLRSKAGKKTLRIKHLVILFFILISFFVAIAELYYYLITCDQLRIKNVEVISSSPELKQRIESYLQNQNLGNILICDLNYLRYKLSSLRGVKDVRLEKILPSTIKAEVLARVPRVIVHRGNYYLVDEEGQVIENFSELPAGQFPILEDDNAFQQNYDQKVRLACEVLSNLQPETRAMIQKFLFKADGLMEVYLADDPTRIILDEVHFAERLNYYLSHRTSWAQLFGQLEYVDLRIEGRVYIKQAVSSGNQSPVGKKEVS